MIHGLLFSECSQVTENIQHFGYCRIRSPAAFPQPSFPLGCSDVSWAKRTKQREQTQEPTEPKLFPWSRTNAHQHMRNKCRTAFILSFMQMNICLMLVQMALPGKIQQLPVWWRKYCVVRNIHGLPTANAHHVRGGPAAGDSPGTLN